MAAKLIAPTDAVQVTSLVTVIFGGPGIGKTSLAQTADNPITLDFDKGAHRSFNRKNVIQIESWADMSDKVVQSAITNSKTIIVDTAGRMLDAMTAHLIATNAKAGTVHGGLQIQGWGLLKNMFGAFVNQLRQSGKDIILICHEKEEKDGDDRYFRPDIQGGSYTEVHKASDMIGYLWVDRQGQRRLSFAPSEKSIGKDPAYMGVQDIDKYDPEAKSFHRFDEGQSPKFMTNLLAAAKKRMSAVGDKQKEAEKEDAKQVKDEPKKETPKEEPKKVEKKQTEMTVPDEPEDDADPTREAFANVDKGNATAFQHRYRDWHRDVFKKIPADDKEARGAAWVLCQEIAAEKGLVYSTEQKAFVKA